ncbi:MAG TPA: tetratricopeptide repeat protein [Myxococcota bacterium]|nr:tetratricopeptide repeat protein [Myxococcota bacterium]
MSFSSNWQLDLAEIGALRLQHARRAFNDRDPVLALVEAEELLEEEPDNLDALMIVADAALDLGDPVVSRAAFLQAIDLGATAALVFSGLAVTCYELTDLEGCIEASNRALEVEPDLAEAWYYKGIALDQLGLADEATQALRQAMFHDPQGFPMPTAMSTEDIEALLGEALSCMPPELAEWYRRVRFEVHRYPDLRQLRDSDMPLSPSSPALYHGTPSPERQDPWQTLPDRVDVYVGNLERAAALGANPAQLLAASLRNEALDWLGLPDDGLPLVFAGSPRA